jgi:valyl-tRNA synthetase
MAKRAAASVRSGALEMIPAFQRPVWYSWLDKPQDWCVSRQLWWGHRIPAYHVRFEGEGEESKEARTMKKGGDQQQSAVSLSRNRAETVFCASNVGSFIR